jgi:hypothetical protein
LFSGNRTTAAGKKVFGADGSERGLGGAIDDGESGDTGSCHALGDATASFVGAGVDVGQCGVTRRREGRGVGVKVAYPSGSESAFPKILAFLSNLRLIERLLDEQEEQMTYLCLVLFDEKKLDALSKSELDALDKESLAYDDVLKKNGHFIAAQALQASHATTTVRVKDGKVLVTDGPFVETSEQLGGFILIEAKDLNEAIQVASKIPVARLGGIEVRPIKELTRNERS